MPPDSFGFLLGEAIRHFETVGFTSQEEIDAWTERLRQAAMRELPQDAEVYAKVKASLDALFRRYVDGGRVANLVPGVHKFTIESVKPHIRAELDRRIRASADLIKLNRAQKIDETLRRFQGWSTSIPAGGGATGKGFRQTKEHIAKPTKQARYEANRVAIDQGHKLVAAIANAVARGEGAIAAVWHSHWRQAGYDYRPDHKERDGKIYLMRDTWATAEGFVKPDGAGWFEDITQPGQEVFCRCFARYVTALSDLPAFMLTAKGAAKLAQFRAAA